MALGPKVMSMMSTMESVLAKALAGDQKVRQRQREKIHVCARDARCVPECVPDRKKGARVCDIWSQRRRGYVCVRDRERDMSAKDMSAAREMENRLLLFFCMCEIERGAEARCVCVVLPHPLVCGQTRVFLWEDGKRAQLLSTYLLTSETK